MFKMLYGQALQFSAAAVAIVKSLQSICDWALSGQGRGEGVGSVAPSYPRLSDGHTVRVAVMLIC